ncbi:MAG TPA: GNAT family protein [Jatrophihabitantaceae bacterium]|nr:GNAT family protein [Jatrophihabitantaceae bacterium]
MQLRPTYPVRTERLALRPLTDADVDALLSYRGRPDVCRYLPFEPMTRERLLERLSTDLGTTEISAEGQALTLGAELADTGELIGDVVLFFHSEAQSGGELGYVFTPDMRGQGYATEACRAMLALAFDGLGLHRIVARIDPRNDSSVRLAERLGMRLEAHFVRNERLKGEWIDELIYAQLADEWHARTT